MEEASTVPLLLAIVAEKQFVRQRSLPTSVRRCCFQPLPRSLSILPELLHAPLRTSCFAYFDRPTRELTLSNERTQKSRFACPCFSRSLLTMHCSPSPIIRLALVLWVRPHRLDIVGFHVPLSIRCLLLWSDVENRSWTGTLSACVYRFAASSLFSVPAWRRNRNALSVVHACSSQGCKDNSDRPG